MPYDSWCGAGRDARATPRHRLSPTFLVRRARRWIPAESVHVAGVAGKGRGNGSWRRGAATPDHPPGRRERRSPRHGVPRAPGRSGRLPDQAAVPPAKSLLKVDSTVLATGAATPVPVRMMPSSRLLSSELLLMFMEPASTFWVDRP